MKKKTVSIFAASLLAAGFVLAGCGGNNASQSGESQKSGDTSSTGSLIPSDKVFANKRFYFEAATDKTVPGPVSVDLGASGQVSAVSCGRVNAEAGQFSMSGSTLTLSGDFLKAITAGEKTVKVTLDGKSVSLVAFSATKVITTAEEFQNINDNLTGYYLLGNDIDLSSIPNFEPLGYYFSETDTNNAYFHGVLEGNGHTVKNANVLWSDTVATNYGVYSANGTTQFKSAAHKNGDNIGLFQIIGSSGLVKDVNFSNIHVRGRTIVGAIAGNCAGTVQNCTVDSACLVEMGTHFYDDDCNMGGAFGIAAGSATISNVISRVTSMQLGSTGASSVNGVTIEKAGIYLDWNTDYIGKTGNGWDHGTPATNDNPWWKQCAVDKSKTDGTTKVVDSNNSATNGQYAFVGKCWGSIDHCVAQKFQITPMDGTARDVFFGQTHLSANKPTSGDSNLGALSNDLLLDGTGLKTASNYAGFDTSVWNIADGAIPTLIPAYVLQ
jgi:hypothetical protein